MTSVEDTDEAVLPSFSQLLTEGSVESSTLPDSTVVLPDFSLVSGSSPDLAPHSREDSARGSSHTRESSQGDSRDIDTESDGESTSDPSEIAKRAQARVRRRSSSVGKPPGTDLDETQHRKHSVVLAAISERHGEESTTYQLARHNRVGENGWSGLAQFHETSAEELDPGYTGRYGRYRDSLDHGMDYASVQADTTRPTEGTIDANSQEDS